MATDIRSLIQASIDTKQLVLKDETLLATIQQVADACVEAFRNDKKVLFCGNGGSAADAQHISAELSGRFYTDREPLYSEALHVNSSYMTAVANDYSYDVVYSRMVKACGRKGDVLVGITTSGNSKNILQAMEAAKAQGMITVGMTGASGGKMNDVCDFMLRVPSGDTPRIQESHILIGHIICQLIEENIFPK
ncbi:MAG TPA: D-sedoheptulose 7-phosphate isomerase [Bacteroidia bacterium]|jgi:D-sedoheptulose 7-phosphate isomerase|nr:D-sedoheptulose 7-phosphate isomerase [Bacteroidia bacterium]HQF27871.1 D-sedoheptulose 7-phosphate isomerase [Bacteroidia bacterium]HQK98044.1 D-sedoheptulose 7-phosphate isomerase [Bacteroidia bacterium]